MPPSPVIRGWGTSPGSSRAFLGLSQQGKRTPLLSRFSQMAPSASPALPGQGPMKIGGVFGGQEISLGAQQAPRVQVGGEDALCSSPPRRRLLPASPDLPGLRDADPVRPPLLLPPQPPHVLLVHLGVPPVSLGIRVLPPPVAGRRPSCGETLTWHLPTPPSSRLSILIDSE